jgi:hypothetical protein
MESKPVDLLGSDITDKGILDLITEKCPIDKWNYGLPLGGVIKDNKFSIRAECLEHGIRRIRVETRLKLCEQLSWHTRNVTNACHRKQ